MALESSTEVSLVPRRKIRKRRKMRKENPEEDPIQSPCRKRRRKHPDEPEPEPSYEFLNKIPVAILFEILYRLPSRTAHLCKSVSKRWYSLISNPSFARGFIHHRRRHSDSEPFNLLLRYTIRYYMGPPKDKIQVLPFNSSETCSDGKYGNNILNFLPCFKRGRLYKNDFGVASFNDLLLVHNRVTSARKKVGFCEYYICNPYTKQWFKLPRCSSHTLRTDKVGFICEAYENAHYRYKVVLIHSPNEPNATQLHMEVFSSEIGKWCKSVVSSPRGLNPFKRKFECAGVVVACNGMLHWVDTEVNGMIKGFVVFDPFNDAERCNYIDLPVNFSPQVEFGFGVPDNFSFGVFRGRLRILHNPRAGFNHTFSFYVWELEDYNNAGTWCMKHEVCYENMVFEHDLSRYVGLARNFRYSMVEFLAFHPDNGEIVFFKFRNYQVMCTVNMRTRESKMAGKLNCSQWGSLSSAFLLPQPLWPTPVPPLPLQFECSNNC
ncbi:putative F-box protein At3g23950 [Quercus suber]|uniref:F-box/kelch-repeat protein n=1 Tax=Quercus suber TaxID=58331 RepID=A0AAW0K508_QUESU|nr:putative F-box protein At3g23950 [Quercus suber]